MKITLKFLKSNHADKKVIDWFIHQQDDDLEIIINKLIGEEKFQWANWLLSRVLNKEEIVKYAIFSAELALNLHEKKYQENRLGLAIEAMKKRLIDLPTASHHSAAYNAFQSIHAAVDADTAFKSAQAAADAADTAAYDALSTVTYPAAVATATAAYIAATAAAVHAITTTDDAANVAKAAVDDAAAAVVYDTISHAGDSGIARKEMYIKILNYGISLSQELH